MEVQIIEQIIESIRRHRERHGPKAAYVVVVSIAGAEMMKYQLQRKRRYAGGDTTIDVRFDAVNIGDCPVAVDEDQAAMFKIVRID